MILKTIRLQPFAGIVHREIELNPGLNVILGPNEAGKSTVFNALLSSFFTDVTLSKPVFEKKMKPYIPLGGDTASIEVEFMAQDSLYTLSKSWGATTRIELKLPGGMVLTEEDAINSKLQELLPTTEGTFKSALASYQSDLSKTLSELEENGEAARQISDILRGMVLNSDGVSIDGFKARLDELGQEYLGRWDLASNQPEQGRGIENKWKKGAGKVVLAFYVMEEARAAQLEAKEFEEKYDQLNKEINAVKATLREKQYYIERNVKIVEDARERRTLSAEVQAIEVSIGDLKKANSDWPVLANKIQEMDPLLQELNQKIEELGQEKFSVERAEEGRSLRERVERLRRLKAATDETDRKLGATKKLTKEELERIRTASNELDSLQTAIKAGKLAAKIESKGTLIVSVQKDLEPPTQVSFEPSELKAFEARGRIQIVHPEWKMEITSGEVEIDKIISSYQKAQQTLDVLLAQYSIATLNDAVKINEDYERNNQAHESALVNLQDELGGDTLGELETRLAALGAVSSGRSLAVVVQELTEYKLKVKAKKTELEQFTEQVTLFEKKYKSHEELMMLLAEKVSVLRELKTKIDNLKPLPPEVTDVNEFIHQFEQAQVDLESIKTRKNQLNVDRATLEGKAPEQSLEDLDTLYASAKNEFEMCLRKGKALVQLQETTQKLLSQMDAGTFQSFQNELSENLASLTNSKYVGVEAEETIPTGLVRADGGSIPPDLLSTGTKDILGLALRLTMASHFLGDTDGFVMMDDPLVDLDPDRQARAIQVLQIFASDKQTILFTCHPTHAQQLGGHLCKLD